MRNERQYPPQEFLEPTPEITTWKHRIDFFGDTFDPDGSFEQHIQQYVSDTGNFLGKGGAASVYSIGNGTCIKLLVHRHENPNKYMYDLGATPAQETSMQYMLRDLTVNGVFTPKILSYYVGKETAAILMEELSADNLQTILNGEVPLPEQFNVSDFEILVQDYLEEMHDTFNIIHRDIAPRNIMLDRVTGLPRIIDFGRAQQIPPNTHHKEKQEDLHAVEKIATLIRSTFLN